MSLAQKIALDPNDAQETYFRKAAGTARFAYNWALNQGQPQYAASQADPAVPKPSALALRKQLNAIKREQFPWMLDVTKNAPQMAVIHLGAAFTNFFEGRAGYPTFKTKGRHDNFTADRRRDRRSMPPFSRRMRRKVNGLPGQRKPGTPRPSGRGRGRRKPPSWTPTAPPSFARGNAGGITGRSILSSNSTGSSGAPIRSIRIYSSCTEKSPRPGTRWRSPRRQTCHDSRSPGIRWTKRC